MIKNQFTHEVCFLSFSENCKMSNCVRTVQRKAFVKRQTRELQQRVDDIENCLTHIILGEALYKYLPEDSIASSNFQCARICKYLLERESWFNNENRWDQLYEKCPANIWSIQVRARKQAFMQEDSYKTLLELRKVLRDLKKANLCYLGETKEYGQFCVDVKAKSKNIKDILKSLYDKWE